MYDWQLIFGDKLHVAVCDIKLQALDRNTVEAYNNAIQQLHGIDFLLLCMGIHGDVTIRLGNEIAKLERFRDAVKAD